MGEDDRLDRYIAEDAERWYAVHARIDAIGLALCALGLSKAAEPETLRGVIRVLQLGLQPGSDGSPRHPAFAADLQRLISAWGETLTPRPVAAPRPDATPSAEG